MGRENSTQFSTPSNRERSWVGRSHNALGSRARLFISLAATLIVVLLLGWSLWLSGLAPLEIATGRPDQSSILLQEKVRLGALMDSLASHLYETDQNYEARDRQLKAELNQISQAGLKFFAAAATDRNKNHDVRRASLYLLTLAGQKAAPALEAIAASPMPVSSVPLLREGQMAPSEAQADPHSEAMLQRAFESSIRIGALEGLDRLTVTASRREAERLAQSLAAIAELQKDPTLRFFAQVSALGLKEGRPGKLTRLTNEMISDPSRLAPASATSAR